MPSTLQQYITEKIEFSLSKFPTNCEEPHDELIQDVENKDSLNIKMSFVVASGSEAINK